MIRLVFLFCILTSLVGCAIPKDSTSFTVRASDDNDEPYLSSQQLLVAGLVSEALGLGARGRFFDSEIRLRRALYLDPQNDKITFNLAVVLAQSGNLEEARELLDKLRLESPQDPRLLLALADIFNAEGRFRESREALKDAFSMYQQAGNTPQAALVSRSISNIAFAEGYEQEALCYSFEALQLAPDAQQVGYHGNLLVGLNLYREAREYLRKSVESSASNAASARVLHALALASYGMGDREGALDAAERAQDMIASAPELGAEVNVTWWLLMQDKPEAEMTDTLKSQLEAVYPEVLRLQEKPEYRLMLWPAIVREELLKVPRSL